MKEITMTCPFTGVTFNALADALGNVYFVHPLTGEQLKMNYNCSIKKYNVQKEWFEPIETVRIKEAAEILGVSRQRASAIAATNVIRPVLVDGQQRFLKSDVLKYRLNRKYGAPKKEA